MKFRLVEEKENKNTLDLNEALGLRQEKDVNESLQNDEISLFFKRAKEVGAKTLGDLKRLLQEPEFAGKDEAQGMKDYRDSLGKDFKIEESLDLDKMQGIKLPDYYNTWSAIDSLTVSIDGKEPVTYYLMENDVYGDETFYLVVTKDLKTIYETFDDIETCLRDEGVLNESYKNSWGVEVFDDEPWVEYKDFKIEHKFEKLYIIYNSVGETIGTANSIDEAKAKIDNQYLDEKLTKPLYLGDESDYEVVRDFLDFLSDHEIAKQDFVKYFNLTLNKFGEVVGIEKVHIIDIMDWIMEHPQLQADFEAFIGHDLDEKLIQGKSDATLKKNITTSESVKEEADISESVQGKTCSNDINSLSKLLKRDFGKGTAKHEGNFRFTFKTDKGKTYDVVTSPVDSKDGEDAKKIKIDDILGPIDDEEYDDIEEAYREPVDDLSDSEAKELENLANNIIKESKMKGSKTLTDLNEEMDDIEEPVIDYTNPNVKDNPTEFKAAGVNETKGK